MTDMVEKVARSIAEVGGVMYERCPDYWNECARAAIRTLMEPTEGMQSAGWTSCNEPSMDEITTIWQAMIKAALDD